MFSFNHCVKTAFTFSIASFFLKLHEINHLLLFWCFHNFHFKSEENKIFSGEIILCDKCITFSEAGTFPLQLLKLKWIKHVLLQKVQRLDECLNFQPLKYPIVLVEYFISESKVYFSNCQICILCSHFKEHFNGKSWFQYFSFVRNS